MTKYNERKLKILWAIENGDNTRKSLLSVMSETRPTTIDRHLTRLQKFGYIKKSGREYSLAGLGKNVLAKLKILHARGEPLNLRKCVKEIHHKSGKVWRIYVPTVDDDEIESED